MELGGSALVAAVCPRYIGSVAQDTPARSVSYYKQCRLYFTPGDDLKPVTTTVIFEPHIGKMISVYGTYSQSGGTRAIAREGALHITRVIQSRLLNDSFMLTFLELELIHLPIGYLERITEPNSIFGI